MNSRDRVLLSALLISLIAVGFGLAAAPAEAAFRIPASVYETKELDEAIDRAKRDEKSLAFLLSNKDTDCGLATAASLAVIKELRTKAVVVYVASEERDKLPDIVREALGSEAAGKYIPKTVVTDARARRVLAIVPYARGDAMTTRLREVVRRLP